MIDPYIVRMKKKVETPISAASDPVVILPTPR
jgi:hypothetical protein